MVCTTDKRSYFKFNYSKEFIKIFTINIEAMLPIPLPSISNYFAICTDAATFSIYGFHVRLCFIGRTENCYGRWNVYVRFDLSSGNKFLLLSFVLIVSSVSFNWWCWFLPYILISKRFMCALCLYSKRINWQRNENFTILPAIECYFQCIHTSH